MSEVREIIDFRIESASLVAHPLPGQDIGISGRKIMQHDTQPLTPDQVPEITLKEQQAQVKAAWEQVKNSPIMQALKTAYQRPEPAPHVHGPFTFLMNQNHNALRGCNSCGAAWVGVMAGTEDTIRWHEVQEVPEEEEE